MHHDLSGFRAPDQLSTPPAGWSVVCRSGYAFDLDKRCNYPFAPPPNLTLAVDVTFIVRLRLGPMATISNTGPWPWYVWIYLKHVQMPHAINSTMS